MNAGRGGPRSRPLPAPLGSPSCATQASAVTCRTATTQRNWRVLTTYAITSPAPHPGHLPVTATTRGDAMRRDVIPLSRRRTFLALGPGHGLRGRDGGRGARLRTAGPAVPAVRSAAPSPSTPATGNTYVCGNLCKSDLKGSSLAIYSGGVWNPATPGNTTWNPPGHPNPASYDCPTILLRLPNHEVQHHHRQQRLDGRRHAERLPGRVAGYSSLRNQPILPRKR